MSEKEHTSLPWDVIQDSGHIYIQKVYYGDGILSITGEYSLAEITNDDWLPVTGTNKIDGSGEANAAFIKRACNSHYKLVDALKRCVDKANRITDNDFEESGACADARVILALIKTPD